MMAIRKFASTSSTAHVVMRILTTGITGGAAITTHAEQLQMAPRYLAPATASSSLDASIHPNIQGSASVRMQNPLLHLIKYPPNILPNICSFSLFLFSFLNFPYIFLLN